MLSLCQHSYEALLERELGDAGLAVAEKGPGWALCEGRAETPLPAAAQTDGSEFPARPDLAFPHLTLLAPREFKGESVNALAQQLADFFLESLRGERIDAAWPCVFHTVPEVIGLGRRASGVEKAFAELLRKKLNRVAKLAMPDVPRGAGKVRGLFVFFADFRRVFAAREVWLGGQRRMADDDAAPSRSYLKVEEAY
ncbi:MAG TPA: rRNA methyltransferase, partial [Lacunisphaera sp.]